ncbi:MAG: hypothetical protein RL077_1586, partial [Verrucomicrobiota bacterium]
SPNQTGGLGSYSFVPIPLSCRALLPFIMKQSSENIVTRYTSSRISGLTEAKKAVRR